MNPDDQLRDELLRLAITLDSLKQRATELGMFTDDRELLECPLCGLTEDVTFDGVLITYQRDDLWTDHSQPDSGLRFESVGGDTYRCPVCQCLLLADLGD